MTPTLFKSALATALTLSLGMPLDGLLAQTSAPNTKGDSISPGAINAKRRERQGDALIVDDQGKIHLDFVNVEIADMAKSISELTKQNFILDEKVRGKITVISPLPVTIKEAYQAFMSALEVKNFTVVGSGKMKKIVPLRDMKKKAISTSARGIYGVPDQYITRLVSVHYTKASDIAKSLRNLVTPNGDILSYDPTNTLIITDSVANLRRLVKIIRDLDQEGYKEGIRWIHLKYAAASDVAQKITKLFNIKPNLPSRTTRTIQAKGKVSTTTIGGSNDSQSISKILADERTNSLIVVANETGFKEVEDLVKKIDVALMGQAAEGKIHVHYLQYADATELAATLSGVSQSLGRTSSGGAATPNRTIFTTNNSQRRTVPRLPNRAQGSGTGVLGETVQIVADEQTNSLIITANPSDYQTLLPVIYRLDIRRPQAFVEAMLMEVDIDKAFEVGLTTNMAGQVGSSDSTSLFGATTFGSNSSIFLPTSPASLSGLAFGLQGKTVDVPLANGETLSIPIFGAFFRALQTNGTINVLSTPNLLTKDNSEAEIVIGQRVPFVTAQGRDINNQPINQVQREDVALTLKIKPQINASNEMTLEIFQEVQDIVPGANSENLGPTTSKRSATTTVLAKDGQTITIGGLISDRIREAESKVPILGDIPLLGWLFRSKSKQKQKQSLVMFITPHIIRDPADMENITRRKKRQQDKFLRYNHMDPHPALKNYGLERNFNSTPNATRPQPNQRRKVNVDSADPTGSFFDQPARQTFPSSPMLPVEEDVAEDGYYQESPQETQYDQSNAPSEREQPNTQDSDDGDASGSEEGEPQ